jgi:MFS family permease
VSLAFTVAALTVALCSPYAGRLLDRYPARYIVLPCMLIYGVAFGSLSLLTGHIWHLLAVLSSSESSETELHSLAMHASSARGLIVAGDARFQQSWRE